MNAMSIEELQRDSLIYLQKQSAFCDNILFFDYRFEKDSGHVPQIETAKEYVKNWDAMQNHNIGLLFWGKPGNGKTFAAACIANQLCENGFYVRMTTLGDYLTRFSAMSLNEKEQYFHSITQCDLLIIDDFGMERHTDYAQEQIFQVINKRYLAGKPLILTTNLNISQLKTPVDMQDERIFDRVLEMCVPVCFKGESLRKAKAGEKMRLIKDIIK